MIYLWIILIRVMTMTDSIININEDISLHLGNKPTVLADCIIIEDNYDYIAINIDDWQAFKDAGDKLVALKIGDDDETST